MKALDRIVLPTSATIRQAMLAIDAGGVEICLVVNESGRLEGVVTDGDVRRALLAGAGFEASILNHMSRRYHAVGPEVGRAEALDLMLAHGFTQLPVIDGAGRVSGLHLLRELAGRAVRPNHAVLMAGGRGIRLLPITEHIPKPMIRIAGRPILERLVLHLIGYGIRHIHLAVNYMSDVIEQHFGDGSRFGCQIEYLREDQPLGSAGAITLLREPPTHPLLVLNGDLVTQVNIDHLLNHHEAGGYSATMGVRHHALTVPFGVVDHTPDMRLAGLREKPTEVFLINAGIYVLSPACWARLERAAPVTMPDVLVKCLQAGEPPGLFLVEDDWLDVGRHDDLRRANGESAGS